MPLPHRLGAAAIIGALAAGCTSAASPGENEVTSHELRPARHGDIAIQEELDAARRTATVEAYDLFIARHPQHRLTEIARRERARLDRPPDR